MMEKEAKTNLKIIISAVILLALMIGVVYSFSITFVNPLADTKLSAANNTLIINITIDEPGGLNISNATFYYNDSGTAIWREIGSNLTANVTNRTFGWDLSLITNGTYTLNVTVYSHNATDDSYLVNSTLVTGIQIDAVYPTLTSYYPENGSFSNGLMKLTVNDANIQQCNISTNVSGTYIANFTNTSMTSGSEWIINLTQNGYTDSGTDKNFTWNVWCNDTFGNANATLFDMANYSFALDTVTPVVNIISPIDNYNQSTSDMFTFVYNATDINLDTCLLYTNHSGLWGINATNNSIGTNLSAGSGVQFNISANFSIGNDNVKFSWNVWCNDSAGNGYWNVTTDNVITNNWTITFDQVAPNGTVHTPTDNSGEASRTVTFQVNVTELSNIDTCTLMVGYNNSDWGVGHWGFYNVSWNYDNASWHTGSYDFSTTNNFSYDSNYTWNFWCNDSLGNANWTYSTNITFSITTSPLTVTPVTSVGGASVWGIYPQSINYTGFPISIYANVTGSGIDDVWYVLSNVTTSVSSNYINETTNYGDANNTLTRIGTTFVFVANVSPSIDSKFRNPGYHGAWICANNTAGVIFCNNGLNYSSGGPYSGNSAGFYIGGTNSTQLEKSFTTDGLGTLSILWENSTKIVSNDTFMNLSYGYNYTFRINKTTDYGDNITIELVGINVNSTYLAEAKKLNLSINASSDLRDKVGGQGWNISLAWLDVTRFIPDEYFSSTGIGYKYGKVTLPNEAYTRIFYCNGTFSNSNCYVISNCSMTVTNEYFINYSNHEDYIPSGSACYKEINNRTYVYMDRFSGVAGIYDTVNPNITFNYPKVGYNLSDNGTYINISFADAGSGIANDSIQIDLNTTVIGAMNYTFTLTNNLSELCYNRSAPSQKHPTNVSNMECYFDLDDNFNISLTDGQWNMSVFVRDGNNTQAVDSINFTIDTVPPSWDYWNITNESDRTKSASSAIQGVTVRAYINFTDNTTEVETAELQVSNLTTGIWDTVRYNFNPSVISLIGNSTNFNASLVADGILLNATYFFCIDAGCNESGANVSFRVNFTDSAGNQNVTTNLTVQVNDSVAPNISLTIDGTYATIVNISSSTFALNWTLVERNNIEWVKWCIDDGCHDDTKTTHFFNYTSGAVGESATVYTERNRLKSGSILAVGSSGNIPTGLTKLDNGTHYIVVYAYDSWGNLRMENHTVVVDTTTPYGVTVDFINTDWGIAGGSGETPSNMTNYGWNKINVSYSNSGIGSIQYSTTCNSTLTTVVNATNFQLFNNSACLSASNGTKTVTIRTTSGSGAVNTSTVLVGLDNVGPTLGALYIDSVTAANGLEFERTNISLNFSFNDFTYLSSVGYYLDGNPYVALQEGNVDQKLSYNYSINVTSGGTHRLILQANDSVGNARNTSIYTFTVVGQVDLLDMQRALNATLNFTHIERLNITYTNDTEITGPLVVNRSDPVTRVRIELYLNTSGSRANVTIDGINLSAANWQNINFSVVSSDTDSETNIRQNLSAHILTFVRFNSSIDDFIPDTIQYYGRLVVPYNLSDNTAANGSRFKVYYFSDETDYSSKTDVTVCTAAGSTTPYLPATESPCFNVTGNRTGNVTSTVFVPSFSSVAVVNDTIAPLVAVNSPVESESESAFIVNVTVSQDTETSKCKFKVNASGYYNGASYTANTWVTMAGPTLLTGTSQYVCLSSVPLALANTTEGSTTGSYNLTINATDANQNQNITSFYFNVTDSATPPYLDIRNTSIAATTATISVNSTEYVNASVTYLTGSVAAQSSPFTTKTPTISLSGLSASTVVNYTVKVCDYSGKCNTSSQFNLSTSAAEAAAAEEAAAAAGPSGGGVAAVAAQNIAAKTSHLWSSLTSGESISMKVTNEDIAFREIKFTVANALSSVKLEVASLKEKPETLADASDKAYQYLQVTKTKLADEDLSTAKIKFDVTKEWLTENNVAESDVALLRYKDNKWDILSTKLVTSGDLKATYEATTPGFSYFAIGSREGVSEAAPPTEVPTERPPTEVPTERPPEEKVPITPVTPVSTTIWVILAVIMVIVIGAIIYKSQAKKPAKQEKK